METHNQSHPSTLYHPHQKQYPTQYLPSAFPLLFAASKNHNVRYQRHTLPNYGERHQEADRAPHGAEIAVIVAVCRLWKVLARVCEGGTAFVEAISVVDVFAAWL